MPASMSAPGYPNHQNYSTTCLALLQGHCCSVLAVTCRYSGRVKDYNKAYEGAKAAIISKFYGPPTKGVYSPSVQFTLYQMAFEMLAK